jgi:murein DD-endopeptidase MepM/ murein hydrolase activator NlpD
MNTIASALLCCIAIFGVITPAFAQDSGQDEVEFVRFPGLGLRVQVEVAATPVPVRSEGSYHLLYELILTNFDARDVRLDAIDVHAESRADAVLASFDGAALESMIHRASEHRVLTSGSYCVVFLWVEIPEGDPLPDRISHTLTFWGATGAGVGPLILEIPAIEIDPSTQRVIAPPLRGEHWYAHAGPANVSHHRNTLAPLNGILTMDQRFATDWMHLKPTNDYSGRELYAVDWEGTFGSEIHAVADGVVVNVVDGLPNDMAFRQGFTDEGNDEYRAWHEPLGSITWDTIGGNLVTIRMTDGSYAWYEHIQPGTIRVKEGDTVAQGQVLGLVGSSGNAGAPHLHFEITDSPTKGHGNGLPYVFESYTLHERFEPMASWDEVVGSTPEELEMRRGDQETTRDEEIPLGGSVVTLR